MNASKEEQRWYYESMLEAFRVGDSIEDSRMFKLLKSKIDEVWTNY